MGIKKKRIRIDKIRLDGDTQPRTEIDEAIVREYRDAYKAGVQLPPVDVFYDGANYWLADGFHRRWGAFKADIKSLDCVVHEGTREDARWFSYAANQTHGLRRTNEDKAKAVKAALQHPKGAELSDRQIAEHVGVSNTFVGKIRSQVSTDDTSTRKGKDGKSYPAKKPPKKKPESQPEAKEDAEDEPEEEDEEIGEDDGEQEQLSDDDEAIIAIEDTIRDVWKGRLAVGCARVESLLEKIRSEI